MKQILYRLFEHQNLSEQEARDLLHNIAAGHFNNTQIGALITVFQMRNISIEELSGFRNALLELRTPVDFSQYDAIDIVGTGGDGKDTFNISTCASFVVAAAGYPVVKHGNYGASSVSGASNVMEHFGVRFTADNDHLRRSVDRCNMAYLHAPLFNPALKAVAAARKELGVRSFFNMLGPLVNPAVPAYSLLGVYNLSLLRLYSYTYQHLGSRFAVVHSLDGYDEISLTSDFKVVMPQSERIYSPSSLGLHRHAPESIYGGESVAAAAEIFRRVLTNTATEAQTECVVANAAFAIQVICPDRSIGDCIDDAREALLSGRAEQTFDRFIALNSL